MTNKVTIGKTNWGGQVVNVNGRAHYGWDRIAKVEPGPKGYELIVTDTNGKVFEVFGGRAAGGRTNEWFLDAAAAWGRDKPINCTSLVDALNLIANC